jgi:hypothetical protein
MAKELPYFKFYSSEWMAGDITLEDFETQGVFINVCVVYWSRAGDVTLPRLKKRFRENPACIKTLIDEGFIKVDEDDNVSITFLDEQIDEWEQLAEKNRLNGQRGGRPRKKPPVNNKKPPGLSELTPPLPDDNPPVTGAKPKKSNKEEKREEEKKEEKSVARAHVKVKTREEFEDAVKKLFAQMDKMQYFAEFCEYWCAMDEINDCMAWQADPYFLSRLTMKVGSWVDRAEKTIKADKTHPFAEFIEIWMLETKPSRDYLKACENRLQNVNFSVKELTAAYYEDKKNNGINANIMKVIVALMKKKAKPKAKEVEQVEAGEKVSAEEIERIRKEKGI